MLGFAQKLFYGNETEEPNPIDLKVAHHLAPNAKEEVQAFLCYLSSATRQGHLCVHVGETLSPDPASLELPFSEELLRKGAEALPPHLLRQEGNRYYFERYWKGEKQCLEKLKQLLNTEPTLKVNIADLPSTLQPEQAEAILYAAKNSVTLLCGGPGTGKSYTIGQLVRLLQAPKVAIAAPTGKAAIHLEKILGQQVTTLHALLGIREGQKPQPAPLSADLVIVDESSMIDLKMMQALLMAVQPGTRLVLVGDPDQLAPIESGSLFADFVSAFPHIALKKCVRTEVESIVRFANAIKEGDLDQLFNGEIVIHPIEESLQRQLMEAVLARPLNDSFRLLSPVRKGPLGVDALNQLCASKRQPEQPIILTRTDRALGLYNGQTGILGADYALFDGKRLAPFLLPSYEYAYCLSVYKSQGSEFDEVWLVLPPGSEFFGKEMLYTAVTRARKKVQIWGSKEMIEKIMKRNGRRVSSLT